MHRYLKSIGFDNITTKAQLKALFNEILRSPDSAQAIRDTADSNFCVVTKEFAPNMGIALCGDYTENDDFELEFYYPYFNGQVISTNAPCEFRRQGEKEAYCGSCDDYRVGITIIFHLNNFMDMKEIEEEEGVVPETKTLQFSALASEGKILLPIYQTNEELVAARRASQKRTAMIEAARNGDKSAMEYLTEDEMRIFSHLNREIGHTDLYSLISSYFMPDGMECDHYAVLGDIERVNLLRNSYTGEEVYELLLNCNDINFSVVINKADLLGEPEEGRRFKGRVWLQGHGDFAY